MYINSINIQFLIFLLDENYKAYDRWQLLISFEIQILILHRCASEACQHFKIYLRPARYYAILIGSEEKNNKNGFLIGGIVFHPPSAEHRPSIGVAKVRPSKKKWGNETIRVFEWRMAAACGRVTEARLSVVYHINTHPAVAKPD